MHRIAHLQVQISNSHSSNPTFNQPSNCLVTTSSHVPKNIKQYTSEIPHNTLFRLHTSNEFILTCKNTNSLYVIFVFLISNSCHCSLQIGSPKCYQSFGKIHIGELILRRPPTYDIALPFRVDVAR